MMTPEKLQERIAAHMKQRDNLIANLHAIEGAVQEAEYWLKELEAPKGTPEKK